MARTLAMLGMHHVLPAANKALRGRRPTRETIRFMIHYMQCNNPVTNPPSILLFD
jgi:hypothetical protein